MPIVRVAPVAPTAETVSVSSAGVPFASSDHSPFLAPVVFFDRTRTVYSVAFVSVGIVCDAPVADAWRLELHSSLPDFHWTS